MPRVFESEPYTKAALKLPQPQRDKLGFLVELLKKDPHSTLLHIKLLSGKLSNHYSFRITRDWRVIFEYLDEGSVLLISIAHRKDVYR